LNRDFEQVLADFTRLQELGVFRHRDLANTFRVLVQEMRAWANMELIETLQPLEQDDWTHFSRLHNDTLNKAKLFLAKRRKAAAKKGQRKPRRAKSEGV
jgi:DNA-directed RNA polymerase specialized sigma54-like protein